MAQWVRLHPSRTWGSGLIPGQGTKSHMPHASLHAAAKKILRAATKTQCSQINILNTVKKKNEGSMKQYLNLNWNMFSCRFAGDGGVV